VTACVDPTDPYDGLVARARLDRTTLTVEDSARIVVTVRNPSLRVVTLPTLCGLLGYQVLDPDGAVVSRGEPVICPAEVGNYRLLPGDSISDDFWWRPLHLVDGRLVPLPPGQYYVVGGLPAFDELVVRSEPVGVAVTAL
jgi:hypothetical protein